MPPALLLILFFLLLFFLEYLSVATGHSEAISGMRQGRIILKKILLPSLLSASAFACGTLTNGSFKSLIGSSIALIGFGLFATIAYYFADTPEDI